MGQEVQLLAREIEPALEMRHSYSFQSASLSKKQAESSLHQQTGHTTRLPLSLRL